MTRLWWYTARSSGLVAWALLAASMLWGLTLSTRALGRRSRPAWILDLHRFLGGGAVVFTAVHVASIVADSYVHFGLVEVVVPFTGDWHPVAVGWGITGMYLLGAIEVTSLLRARLPHRIWRTTHHLSFPLFVLTSTHALSAGSDRNSVLVRGTVFTASAAVAVLTAVRVARAQRAVEAPHSRFSAHSEASPR